MVVSKGSKGVRRKVERIGNGNLMASIQIGHCTGYGFGIFFMKSFKLVKKIQKIYLFMPSDLGYLFFSGLFDCSSAQVETKQVLLLILLN